MCKVEISNKVLPMLRISIEIREGGLFDLNDIDSRLPLEYRPLKPIAPDVSIGSILFSSTPYHSKPTSSKQSKTHIKGNIDELHSWNQ